MLTAPLIILIVKVRLQVVREEKYRCEAVSSTGLSPMFTRGSTQHTGIKTLTQLMNAQVSRHVRNWITRSRERREGAISRYCINEQLGRNRFHTTSTSRFLKFYLSNMVSSQVESPCTSQNYSGKRQSIHPLDHRA